VWCVVWWTKEDTPLAAPYKNTHFLLVNQHRLVGRQHKTHIFEGWKERERQHGEEHETEQSQQQQQQW